MQLRLIRATNGACHPTLERQSPDGQWWCIPIAQTLDERGALLTDRDPSIEFELWHTLPLRGIARETGARSGAPLPPGRYRLRFLVRDAEGPFRTIERVFSVRQPPSSARAALIQRTEWAARERCRLPADSVLETLAMTSTIAELAPLLDLSVGSFDGREHVWTALSFLPEVRGRLASHLQDPARAFAASTAISRRADLFERAVVDRAEQVFSERFGQETEYSVSAILAIYARSQSPAIVEAVARRIDATTELEELTRWDGVLTCVSSRLDPSRLGLLVRALRRAASRVGIDDHTLQRSLLQQASLLESTIVQARAALDAQLQVARAATPSPVREQPRAVSSPICSVHVGPRRSEGAQCPTDPWPTDEELSISAPTLVLEGETRVDS
jgi:hypothetical protein